jgi:hypothetical protein
LALIQSEKGDKWFGEANSACTYQIVDVNNYIQGPFIKPYDRPKDRDAFWKTYKEKGLNSAFRRYVKTPVRTRISRKMKKLLFLWECIAGKK